MLQLRGQGGILSSSIPGGSSGTGFVQEGCACCQSIPGLAGQGGGGSRFMKSTGRSQLPAAKSSLDCSSRAGLPPRDVMANCHQCVSSILGHGSDRSRDWM